MDKNNRIFDRIFKCLKPSKEPKTMVLCIPDDIPDDKTTEYVNKKLSEMWTKIDRQTND